MEYGPEITVWLEGRIEDVAWMPQEDPTQALLSVTALTKDGRRKITVVADGPSHLDNIRRNIDAPATCWSGPRLPNGTAAIWSRTASRSNPATVRTDRTGRTHDGIR